MLTDVAATRQTVLRLILLKAKQEAKEDVEEAAEAESEKQRFLQKKATKINDTSQNTRRIVADFFF